MNIFREVEKIKIKYLTYQKISDSEIRKLLDYIDLLEETIKYL